MLIAQKHLCAKVLDEIKRGREIEMDILMAPPKILPWWAALTIWLAFVLAMYFMRRKK